METTEEHIGEYPHEDKDEWTKINKEQLDAKFDLKCIFSNEELFQTDSDVKEFEEEWENEDSDDSSLDCIVTKKVLMELTL